MSEAERSAAASLLLISGIIARRGLLGRGLWRGGAVVACGLLSRRRRRLWRGGRLSMRVRRSLRMIVSGCTCVINSGIHTHERQVLVRHCEMGVLQLL